MSSGCLGCGFSLSCIVQTAKTHKFPSLWTDVFVGLAMHPTNKSVRHIASTSSFTSV